MSLMSLMDLVKCSQESEGHQLPCYIIRNRQTPVRNTVVSYEVDMRARMSLIGKMFIISISPI